MTKIEQEEWLELISGKQPDRFASTNTERAEFAQLSMETYKAARGVMQSDVAEEYEISDLISDLLHRSDLLGFDTFRIIERAQINFHAEQAREDQCTDHIYLKINEVMTITETHILRVLRSEVPRQDGLETLMDFVFNKSAKWKLHSRQCHENTLQNIEIVNPKIGV